MGKIIIDFKDFKKLLKFVSKYFKSNYSSESKLLFEYISEKRMLKLQTFKADFGEFIYYLFNTSVYYHFDKNPSLLLDSNVILQYLNDYKQAYIELEYIYNEKNNTYDLLISDKIFNCLMF